jgi:hypothetical protein
MNKFTITAAALAAGVIVHTHAFAQAATVAATSPTAATSSDPESAAHENWRSLMARDTVTAEGCLHASYPNIVWESVDCKVIQPRFHPEHVKRQGAAAQVAGGGHDYVLQSAGLINSALGYFKTTGVTSETGVGVAANNNAGFLGPNEYTLQINTNELQTTPACASHSDCTVWQQFIYSSDYSGKGQGAVFMQYWLIDYGSSCPSGWRQSGSDCFKNSAAAAVPFLSATLLGSMSLAAKVTPGGNDVVTFTYGTEAYVVTAKDSVLQIATVWEQAEFNVVGNGGGSRADFNLGSSITVYLFANDGTYSTPICYSDDGTTGETNNLNLGACQANVFLEPYIQFTEYLVKPPLPIIPPIVGVK